MFETLKRLWAEGKMTETKLDAAVSKGWITAEGKTEIMTQ